MAQQAPKPKRLSVVRDGEIVEGPFVSADSIFVGGYHDITVGLDRRTLKPVWKVDSDMHWLGELVDGELLTVGGKAGAGTRRTADGQLLWSAPSLSLGMTLWNQLGVINTGTELQLHDLWTGQVVRRIGLPSFLDSKRRCGDLWLGEGRDGADPRFKAIELQTGNLAWERDLVAETTPYLREPEPHNAVAIVPATISDLFIATRGDSLFGCSLRDGSIVWQAPAPVPYYWPNVEHGRIYVLFFDRFIAVDEATGKVLYDMQHPELRRAYRAKAGTLYKGRLAIANESGHLAVFDVTDGSLVSLHEDKLPLWRTAEADGRLLVTTGDGKLLVFDESIWAA